jgi:hypothetical protein
VAAAAAPTPPTNPASAFPSGDPRNAEYGETVAAAEHAYNTTLAGDKETLSDSTSNAAYQRSLMGLAEPAGYRTEANRASAGGILESGINAQNRGSLTSKYAESRFKVTKGLQEATDRYNKDNANAEYERNAKLSKASTTALGKGYEALLKEGPDEQAPAAPTNPGAIRTNYPNVVDPGGVAAHSETLPNGNFVRVGAPPPAQPQVRAEAAKRYLNKATGKMETAAQMGR